MHGGTATTRRAPAVTFTRATDMIEQFQKAGLGSNAPEYLQVMLAPMQQQLDVLKAALEAQAEFQQKLTEERLLTCGS
jgi:hypothetical protein